MQPMSRHCLFAALACLALAACAPRAPRPPEPVAPVAAPAFDAAPYRRPATAGRVFWLDAEASTLHVFARRAGALASQGHNHVLVADALEGAVFLPDGDLAQARFDVVMPVDALQVDPPRVREALGEEFASELSPKNREDTRRNLLGERVLDAANHPLVGLSSIRVAGQLPALTATVAVTLRGVRRELDVPLQVEIEGPRLRVNGVLAVRQSEFDITPFSVAAGLLRVADEVEIEFELVAAEAGRAE